MTEEEAVSINQVKYSRSELWIVAENVWSKFRIDGTSETISAFGVYSVE